MPCAAAVRATTQTLVSNRPSQAIRCKLALATLWAVAVLFAFTSPPASAHAPAAGAGAVHATHAGPTDLESAAAIKKEVAMSGRKWNPAV
jgi:hypothetical protein